MRRNRQARRRKDSPVLARSADENQFRQSRLSISWSRALRTASSILWNSDQRGCTFAFYGSKNFGGLWRIFKHDC